MGFQGVCSVGLSSLSACVMETFFVDFKMCLGLENLPPLIIDRPTEQWSIGKMVSDQIKVNS